MWFVHNLGPKMSILTAQYYGALIEQNSHGGIYSHILYQKAIRPVNVCYLIVR